MIDALLYAVRDGIRAAGMNYGIAQCEIQDDGRPPPRAGNVFVAVHGGKSRSTADNQLFELFDFNITITMRLGNVAIDRVGDQLVARNIRLEPEGRRQGLNHKVERLRAFLHMNWRLVVLQGQTPNSANDNLVSWATGNEVYGFCEPMRYRGADVPKLVGADWFGAEPESEDFGIMIEMRFADAKRFQPQLQGVGPFV